MVDENKIDYKEVFILDDKGFFIGTTYLNIEEKQEFKFTTTPLDKNLLKPKFDGEKWIEGVNKNDLMISMLFPENDLGVNTNDFLVLNILKILREGGMIMDNTWFFKYCMFCWAERKIDEAYLDMAKKMDMLTDQQIMMIKMTPRIEEK
ncbi:hypothetical protein [Anaerococcus hydrogenalis]|uniref:Uncharacterized protein n=1 Tax=Anaerococcus hydrogenalis TaxID=33029 RepID=A0A2N6UI86_9FIRM|nr:hypothetical protein [Anaerococcus hydrogenalis]MDK7694706.1 hypothetical protein [Anaerococcus hydrogenalis]MDK7696740.1 hypothetical protein [Anaerococcus hydrogenalis]MDK7707733.1 hypothetical protein [Anaerococcus hydrogenalis]PMC81349.1 hypothetical protein CJ192_04795 [Anaerococcus hydrogenalis]